MEKLNPMLAVAIYEAHAQSDNLRSAVLNAAVHAWYEGHIDGEGEKRAPKIAKAQPMPAPPFPSPQNPVLEGIMRQAQELYTAEELAPAAAAYAAGLAFAAGYAEGVTCPGCSYRGANPEHAAKVRQGRQPIWLLGANAHVGLPAPSDPAEALRLRDAAQRLCAAWVSNAEGLKGIDHTYRKTNADEVGEFWIALAAYVERELSTNMAQVLLSHDEEDADDSH